MTQNVCMTCTDSCPGPVIPGVPDLRDAHLHLHDLSVHGEYRELVGGTETRWVGLSSCHSGEEWNWHRDVAAGKTDGRWNFLLSYGVHPQKPDLETLGFLEDLVERKDPLLAAIGEFGFDFFDPATRGESGNGDMQRKVFEAQLELAQIARLPVVIHLRKATDVIFRYSRKLSTLPAVVFHSWPSPWNEARDLLKRGVNGFFSLGTPLLKGNRNALESMARLPADRVLIETDAPWQTLKGVTHTPSRALVDVCNQAAALRGVDFVEMARLSTLNFSTIFDK